MTQNLLNHCMWADQKIISLLKTMDESLFGEKPANHLMSVRELTSHLIIGYKTQLEDFSPEVAENYEKRFRTENKDEMLSVWSETLDLFVKKFSEALSETTEVKDYEGKPFDVTREELTLTFTDHSTYHRGQIITTYKIVTAEENAVNTDFFTYLVERHKS